MTNSRLTDPEVLEWRFPVVLDAFRLRRGLGGRGAVPRRRRGGAAHPLPRADDGGDPRRAPGGAAAGAGGRRAGGARADADRAGGRDGRGAGEADRREVGPGDVCWLETPGGGGYGEADG